MDYKGRERLAFCVEAESMKSAHNRKEYEEKIESYIDGLRESARRKQKRRNRRQSQVNYSDYSDSECEYSDNSYAEKAKGKCGKAEKKKQCKKPDEKVHVPVNSEIPESASRSVCSYSGGNPRPKKSCEEKKECSRVVKEPCRKKEENRQKHRGTCKKDEKVQVRCKDAGKKLEKEKPVPKKAVQDSNSVCPSTRTVQKPKCKCLAPKNVIHVRAVEIVPVVAVACTCAFAVACIRSCPCCGGMKCYPN